jgi:hypothetical protein
MSGSMFERNVIVREDRRANRSYALHRDGRIVFESTSLAEVEETKARYDERDSDSPTHQESLYGDPDAYWNYLRRS